MVDASAILELVLRTPAASALEVRLSSRGETLHAPHLLDIEALHVLRWYTQNGMLSSAKAQIILGDFAALRIARHTHEPLLDRIWQLRNHFSAYDATYVALAESMNAPLITRDRRLANAAGSKARVEVF